MSHVLSNIPGWLSGVCKPRKVRKLLATRVFSDGFGPFTDSVFGQFPGKEQSDCGLNFARADRWFLVVVCQSWSFCGDPFENIVHERVHDAHSFTRDSCVRMNLLEDFVNVDGVALPSFSSSFSFSSLGGALRLTSSLFALFTDSYSRWILWWHFVKVENGV